VRHVRMLGLCLAAACAIVAVAATSASALPEWGQCFAKKGGKYANSNCTEKAKAGAGEFEFRKGTAIAHKGFTGAGGTGVLNTLLETCKRENQKINEICGGEETDETIPSYVECESENAKGEASGTKDVSNVQVTFHGCKLLGTASCNNTGKEGEIKVNTLKGTLGYINKSQHEVGVDLTPAKKKAPFAEFACSNGELNVAVGEGPNKWENSLGKVTEQPYYSKGGGDAIISPITPVNQMTSSFTQVYTTNTESENIPSKFEGKPIQLLEDYAFGSSSEHVRSAWSRAGETITNVNTTEEPVMIKA
jgi:hypothetical protein